MDDGYDNFCISQRYDELPDFYGFDEPVAPESIPEEPGACRSVSANNAHVFFEEVRILQLSEVTDAGPAYDEIEGAFPVLYLQEVFANERSGWTSTGLPYPDFPMVGREPLCLGWNIVFALRFGLQVELSENETATCDLVFHTDEELGPRLVSGQEVMESGDDGATVLCEGDDDGPRLLVTYKLCANVRHVDEMGNVTWRCEPDLFGTTCDPGL